MRRFRAREHVSSLLVATLSSAFGVALLTITGVLAAVVSADDVTGGSSTVAIMLGITATVFIVIAVYVGAIVTSNTFSTIIAGRTRTIALLRLIGSSAAAQRRAVAGEGFLTGILGSAAGVVVGAALAGGFVRIGVALGALPDLAYDYLPPIVALPAVVVVLTTWLASWLGSRRVLTVTPIQAIGGAQELSIDETRARPARNVFAIVLLVVGVALVLLGVLAGLVTPLGVLIGVVGGILSFTGVVLGAHLVMPPALRLVGRLMGRGADVRLAAENAMRYPERSSRITIGLVIAVTLITMFAVAMESYRSMLATAAESQPGLYDSVDEVISTTVVIFSVLIGFSALIAAVGMVNSMSLSVLQRTRELGLLRALGFTVTQIRRMILAESAQLTVTSALVGLVLGVFYGWAGAQSLLGSLSGSPGLVFPAVPWVLLPIIVVAAGLLTVAASFVPSRRATRVAPVRALAVD